MNTATVPGQRAAPRLFGEHLRHWRQHRRLSQLDLAQEAEISTRHLSFVETGRSLPSREMVLRLAERLDVPLRERNALLVAAGYAPMYRERPLDDPALAAAKQAVELILKATNPIRPRRSTGTGTWSRRTACCRICWQAPMHRCWRNP